MIIIHKKKGFSGHKSCHPDTDAGQDSARADASPMLTFKSKEPFQEPNDLNIKQPKPPFQAFEYDEDRGNPTATQEQWQISNRQELCCFMMSIQCLTTSVVDNVCDDTYVDGTCYSCGQFDDQRCTNGYCWQCCENA